MYTQLLFCQSKPRENRRNIVGQHHSQHFWELLRPFAR